MTYLATVAGPPLAGAPLAVSLAATSGVVVLVVGLAALLSRRGGGLRVLDLTRLGLGALTLAAAGYSIFFGLFPLLAVVAAPLFAGVVAVSVLRRRFEPGPAEGGGRTGGSPIPAGAPSAVGVWLAWVGVSAAGGALAVGVTIGLNLSFFGVLILYGGILAIPQALVLSRHFSGAWLWVVASFFGWVVGSLVGTFPGFDLSFAGVDTVRIAEWAGLGIAQSFALLAVPFTGGGGARPPASVLLWLPAGIVGGVLAAAAPGFIISALIDPIAAGTGQSQAAGGGFLYEAGPNLAGEVAAGGIYGVLTGVVLAAVLRGMARGEYGRYPTELMAAGIVALVAVAGAGGLWVSIGPSQPTCTEAEKAILEEFPQYGSRQSLQPHSNNEGYPEKCIVTFKTDDGREEVFDYYSQKLQQRGWECPMCDRRLPPPPPRATNSGAPSVATLASRREGIRYDVTYTRFPSGKDRVEVGVYEQP